MSEEGDIFAFLSGLERGVDIEVNQDLSSTAASQQDSPRLSPFVFLDPHHSIAKLNPTFSTLPIFHDICLQFGGVYGFFVLFACTFLIMFIMLVENKALGSCCLGRIA